MNFTMLRHGAVILHPVLCRGNLTALFRLLSRFLPVFFFLDCHRDFTRRNIFNRIFLGVTGSNRVFFFFLSKTRSYLVTYRDLPCFNALLNELYSV